jgi:predicted nucleic acid-binding Zn ribbon protein
MTRRAGEAGDVGHTGDAEAERLGEAITRFLRRHGHAERVQQTAVLDDWSAAVGPQIARVAQARAVTADGILIVAVSTNAWMAELSLHEREFVARLNDGLDRPRVRRIRWHLLGQPAGP